MDSSGSDFLRLARRVKELEASAAMNVPGVVAMWAGSEPPAGWLICDGSEVSRSVCAALFSAIGTTYGSGNGSTTFNLPNLKGRVAVGLNGTDAAFDALGETGGEKVHALTTAEMPTHSHTQDMHTHTQNAHAHSITNGSTDVYGFARMSANSTAWLYNADKGTPRIKESYDSIANATATNQYTTATNQNAGGSYAHNNLQPYIVLNYIIKT